MSYAIPAWELPTVAVAGSEDRFPVHRIYCVGRNYAEHAREMGHNPERDAPFFFTKPADAVVPDGSTIPFPMNTENLHHEIELVVALGKDGVRIAKQQALDYVFGYAVGLDLTRRDRQGEAKKAGRPWDTGKAFDRSAPCAAIYPVSAVGHPSEGTITLSINGELRQQGDLNELIWSVPEVISMLSESFELKAGDLIFTGTPAGVGPLQRGDRIEGAIAGLGTLGITLSSD